MNIYLTAIVAIVFFVLATVVIVTTSQQEQEIKFLDEEEQDRAQHNAMYRESFAILFLGICFLVTAAAFALFAITTH